MPADGLDWFAHRLFLSPHVKDSRHTIETDWTMLDAIEMHIALDVLEDQAALARLYRERTRPPAR
jgi:hypothetical protein